jgi:hypothetical protein
VEYKFEERRGGVENGVGVLLRTLACVIKHLGAPERILEGRGDVKLAFGGVRCGTTGQTVGFGRPH